MAIPLLLHPKLELLGLRPSAPHLGVVSVSTQRSYTNFPGKGFPRPPEAAQGISYLNSSSLSRHSQTTKESPRRSRIGILSAGGGTAGQTKTKGNNNRCSGRIIREPDDEFAGGDRRRTGCSRVIRRLEVSIKILENIV